MDNGVKIIFAYACKYGMYLFVRDFVQQLFNWSHRFSREKTYAVMT